MAWGVLGLPTTVQARRSTLSKLSGSAARLAHWLGKLGTAGGAGWAGHAGSLGSWDWFGAWRSRRLNRMVGWLVGPAVRLFRFFLFPFSFGAGSGSGTSLGPCARPCTPVAESIVNQSDSIRFNSTQNAEPHLASGIWLLTGLVRSHRRHGRARSTDVR